MRIVKHHTDVYPAFVDSLKLVTKNKVKGVNGRNINYNYITSNENVAENKYQLFYESVTSFENQFQTVEEVSEIADLFSESLSKLVQAYEMDIFTLDSDNSLFVSLLNKNNKVSKNFINKAYKQGIIDWLFENNRFRIIPDFDHYNSKGASLNYLLFPLKEKQNQKIVLSILTPQSHLSEGSIEAKIIQVLFGMVFNKIISFSNKVEQGKIYEELQAYQLKFKNDYKLSAIGELTSGIIEDILTPLQVIVSNIDLLEQDKRTKKEYPDTIRTQAKKIELVINRLIKFSDVNSGGIQLFASDLNKVIGDFHDVINSTIKIFNYECVLDLEDKLPKVLSQSEYLDQLLTNSFSLLCADKENGGGLFIQTKYKNSAVYIRFVSTDFIPDTGSLSDNRSVNIKIIRNLMLKHDGNMEIASTKEKGTTLTLKFPLQRKLKK